MTTIATQTHTNTETSQKTRTVPMFKVLLHNDSVNDFSHVVHSLMTAFHLSYGPAFEITVAAHRTGVALCKVEPLEHAELHRDQLHSFFLTATIEPD